MQAPQHFEQTGTRGYYRPVGVVTFEQATDLIVDAMRYARELGLKDLLVNTDGLSGFASPSTVARYVLAVRGAEIGAGSLRLGVVARRDIVDSQKIGVVVAQNRGLDTDVFTSELDAIRWLDSRPGARA